MKRTKKIWGAIFYLFLVSILLNGAYFFLSIKSSQSSFLDSIVIVLTPAISAVNYLIMGFAAGIGFYLAMQKTEKKEEQ